ncbi:DsrE family protein [Dyadobacter sp. LHD-138]|uniref:DsrE family protein n=1 Tax=Dyadobacter sp. LHD-138 TaxID=3071413 RepID=UPI0027E15B25|nr:DsrE family protein [Dyadobacter sp. LHD-138]MDQ6479562.1 DsrE family protein [Dyadobacter sp. LHD-138]
MNAYKAIIQLTSPEPKVYKSTIRQIFNLLDYFNDNVQVKIVCHGASGPFCLKDQNPFTEEIVALLRKNVKIEICNNMLISNNILPKDLIAGIEIIPSGIAELVIRQQEGWSYIKAGF